MRRRTWLGLAAGVLVLAAGAAVAGKLREHGTETAAAPPGVVLQAPAPPEPQADLLQPVPTEAPAEPAGTVTAARWPLAVPATQEPPPAPGLRWSRPEPLALPAADACAPSAAASPWSPSAPGVRPMPPLASVSQAKPAAKHRPAPLTGTHACVLTDGTTLVLPEKVRRMLDEPKTRELFATPGPEPSLWLYTAGGLERLAEQFDRSPQPAARVRGARRAAFAQAEACMVDRGGRALLPERLVQFAGLQQEVVLLGVGDHLELWDAQRWQDYLRRTTENREERGR